MTEPAADLVAFIRARLDEDEEVARKAVDENWAATRMFYEIRERDYDAFVHIARNDPARVLRRVEANRRIVKSFAASGVSLTTRTAEFAVVRMVLRLLASVHSDHPDFREEWRS